MQILLIVLFWGLMVANTELLIKWNHFQGSTRENAIWQFGQVRLSYLRCTVQRIRLKASSFELDFATVLGLHSFYQCCQNGEGTHIVQQIPAEASTEHR